MAGRCGRSGRRPEAQETKRAKGETRPSREANTNVVMFPRVGTLPDAPDWLNVGGKAMWVEVGPLLVAQHVLTTPDLRAFAQLCQLDGRLIDKARRNVEATASEISQHRMYCAEFGITPTSRTGVGGANVSKQNPFARNGPKRSSNRKP